MPRKKQKWQDVYWANVDKRGPDECWEYKGGKAVGYGYVGAYQNARGKYGEYAHRLTYMIHHGPIPKGVYIRHRCHNKLCCNEAHLIAGTPKDNHRDSYKAGRLPKMNCSGLSHDDVREIRRLYADKEMTQTAIARKYNMTQANVSAICRRKTWQEVE